jgi:uncharacterized protein YjbI with pentapeptide repeats
VAKPQLDGERKALLLEFLWLSGLVGIVEEGEEHEKACVSLFGADLTEACLSGADLTGAEVRDEQQLAEAKSLEGATLPR